MPGEKVYERLIERLRSWVFNLPDAPFLMQMLELRFSPAEAEFLCGFPFMPSTVEQLTKKLGLPAEHLAAAMQPMIEKGLICALEDKGGTRYSFTNQVFFLYRMPGWKGEDDDWNRQILPLANKYYVNHLGADLAEHPSKGLRAIPVARTIKDTRQILPYEDVLEYVAMEDYHAVSPCACRHRHNIDPDAVSCKHALDTCLHFGPLAHYTVQHRMARQISCEETLEILENAADAGLVHGISNFKKRIDTLCNCCSCCCLFLEPVKMLTWTQARHQRSDYKIEHNHDTCKACGLCAQRCPVKAIQMRDKQDMPQHTEGERLKPKDLKEVAYSPDQCIGCGVCAHKCPTQSLRLVRRSDSEEDIPETQSELGRRFLTERGRDMSKIF